MASGHDSVAQKRTPYAPRASDFLSNFKRYVYFVSASHFLRGRLIVRQYLFRHKDKDHHRKSMPWCRIHRIRIPRCVRTVSHRLRGYLQAWHQGKDPRPHSLLYGQCSCRPETSMSLSHHIVRLLILSVVIGSCSFLREFSHGKDMTYITMATIVFNYHCVHHIPRASKSVSLQRTPSAQILLTS